MVCLTDASHEVVDFGSHRLDSGDDYPDFVIPLARSVAAGQVDRGVVVCGKRCGRIRPAPTRFTFPAACLTLNRAGEVVF